MTFWGLVPRKISWPSSWRSSVRMSFLVLSLCLVFSSESLLSLWSPARLCFTAHLVYLHHCPFKAPNETVAGALSAFGTVLDVQFSCFTGSTVRNGSRVVKISLQEEIPTKLFVLHYPCRVWYRGQVQVCNICCCSEHHAASWPIRDLCFKSHQDGHFARDCPGVSAHATVVDLPAVDVPVADGSDESDLPASFFFPWGCLFTSSKGCCCRWFWPAQMLPVQFWPVALLVAAMLLMLIHLQSSTKVLGTPGSDCMQMR